MTGNVNREGSGVNIFLDLSLLWSFDALLVRVRAGAGVWCVSGGVEKACGLYERGKCLRI